MRKNLPPALLVGIVMTLAACQTLPITAVGDGKTTPGAAMTKLPGTPDKAAPVATGPKLQGQVKAPAGLVGNGGANLSAAAAPAAQDAFFGTEITQTAAFAGGTRHLMEVGETGLAKCEVFLADGAGKPLPGIDPVQTDANGKFEFTNVPPDFTYVVAARCKTKDGKDALLQTLTKPGALGGTCEIDAASTLVTAGVVEGSEDGLGSFNAATFETARVACKRELKESDIPDFSDRAAVKARIGELAKTVGALKGAIEEMQKSLKEVKQSLEELRKQLANRPKPDARPPEGQPGEPPLPGQPPREGEKPGFPPGIAIGEPNGRPPVMPPMPCDQAFKGKDLNGDGAITLDEFIKGAVPPPPPSGISPNDRAVGIPAIMPVTLPEQAFRERDRNGDGKVSFDEACPPVAQPPQPPRPPEDGCKDYFVKRDTNGDGGISPDEFKASEPSNVNLEAVFKERDRNGDGKIGYEEACLPIVVPRPPQPPIAPINDCKMIFLKIDVSADGSLTYDEWKASQTNTANAEASFKERDRNGDGKIGAEEFCGFVTQPQPPRPPEEKPPVVTPPVSPPLNDCRIFFSKKDTNADGAISYEEWKLSEPASTSADVTFKQQDKNADGKISVDEICGVAPPVATTNNTIK